MLLIPVFYGNHEECQLRISESFTIQEYNSYLCFYCVLFWLIVCLLVLVLHVHLFIYSVHTESVHSKKTGLKKEFIQTSVKYCNTMIISTHTKISRCKRVSNLDAVRAFIDLCNVIYSQNRKTVVTVVRFKNR